MWIFLELVENQPLSVGLKSELPKPPLSKLDHDITYFELDYNIPSNDKSREREILGTIGIIRNKCLSLPRGRGVLHIFWVRGRAIGKGIDFRDFGIRNGIDFRDFGIRNGIDFHDFGIRNGIDFRDFVV